MHVCVSCACPYVIMYASVRPHLPRLLLLGSCRHLLRQGATLLLEAENLHGQLPDLAVVFGVQPLDAVVLLQLLAVLLEFFLGRCCVCLCVRVCISVCVGTCALPSASRFSP